MYSKKSRLYLETKKRLQKENGSFGFIESFYKQNFKHAHVSTHVYVKYIMRYIRYLSELHNFRKEIVSAAG